MSKGLVKSVYLAHAAGGGAVITQVKASVRYLGPYPTAPLSSASAGPWAVDLTAYLLAPAGAPAGGSLQLSPAWGAAPAPLAVPALAAGVETPVAPTLQVAAGAVGLWWPNTVAASRPLYAINVTLALGAGAPVQASTRVGFRALALVTADDTVPARLAGLQGSGDLTLRLKVNGANIAVRGANWIPLDELTARLNDTSTRAAVASAAAAGMSMLRVWGGGLYPDDALLNAADEAGLLLFQDAMYASQDNSHHFAKDTPEQRQELIFNVRRLSSHPSFAIGDSCNECGGSSVFQDMVAAVMALEDPSRPIWPASPSQGWASGVSQLWGTPLPGQPLQILTRDAPIAPVPGCPNCTSQTGVFYYGFPVSPFLTPLPVKDAAACCALCAATPMCAIGNYASGGCQLISPPFAPLPRDPASVAVFPGSGGAAPLPVPAVNKIEIHGPYQGGGGWPTVNGGGPPARAFDPQLPPTLAPTNTAYGPAAPGVFTSEFGVGQPASFEIMAPTLSPHAWGMHGGSPADSCTAGFAHVCTGGNYMAQRNYGCDNAWATLCVLQRASPPILCPSYPPPLLLFSASLQA